MNEVVLLSRRDPQADWSIRNRFGRHKPGSPEHKEALRAANVAMHGWLTVEPVTEFMVSEEKPQ